MRYPSYIALELLDEEVDETVIEIFISKVDITWSRLELIDTLLSCH